MQALILKSGSHVCAIPLVHVRETMRPLPIEPLANAPAFVCGVSMVRGEPVPVVDLRRLLGGEGAAGEHTRFVTLEAGERRLAVAVDGVAGLKTLDAEELRALPDLLGGLAMEAIEAIGTSDAQLLLLLRASRLIPESEWAKFAPGLSQ